MDLFEESSLKYKLSEIKSNSKTWIEMLGFYD